MVGSAVKQQAPDTPKKVAAKVVEAEASKSFIGRISLSTLFAALVTFRTLNALLVNSVLFADETFQSLEIAYRFVFGSGHVAWEWRPEFRIRSFLHPLFHVPAYALLKYLGLESTSLLVALPKVQQAFIAALLDLSTFLLARELHGGRIALYALTFSLLSWFNFYYATRTLSNSIDAAAFTAALYFWHRKSKPLNTWAVSFLFGLACTLRPSCAIPILLQTAPKLYKLAVRAADSSSSLAASRILIKLLASTLFAANFFVLLSVVLDTWCTRILFNDNSLPYTFTQYNFFYFNVVKNYSAYFGVFPWYFYFAAALPALYGPYLAYVALASWRRPVIAAVTDMTPLLLSLLLSFFDHKEIRFISTVLPLLIIGVARAHCHLKEKSPALARACMQFSVVIGALVWYYFANIFQADAISAANWLRNNRATSVVSLTRCYIMPGQCYLGPRIQYGELTCDPPFEELVPSAIRSELASSPPRESAQPYIYHEPTNHRVYLPQGAHHVQQRDWYARFGLAAPPSHVVVYEDFVAKFGNVTGSFLLDYAECQRYYRWRTYDLSGVEALLILCRNKPQLELPQQPPRALTDQPQPSVAGERAPLWSFVSDKFQKVDF